MGRYFFSDEVIVRNDKKKNFVDSTDHLMTIRIIYANIDYDGFFDCVKKMIGRIPINSHFFPVVERDDNEIIPNS